MENKLEIPIKRLRTNSFELVPLFDIHYGSHECQEKEFSKIIDYIRRKSTCYTFLGGDLIECVIYGKVGGVHAQKFQTTEQIENVVKILNPIKNKIWFAVNGNHENRVEKSTGINIMQLMAEMLEIPYLGWEANFLIKLKNANIRCYAHHGSGSGVTSGAKLNAIERLHFRSPFAHIIFCGHTHFPFMSEKEIRYIDNDGKLKKFSQYFVSSGSLHESDGYATMRAYGPVPIRLNKVKVRNINGNIIVESHKFI